MCFSAEPAADGDVGAHASRPARLVGLDEALQNWFDGAAHASRAPDDARAGFTLSLTTIDEAGWPRTALLGLAEVFAPDSGHLVLALWQASRSNRCLRAQGRALLSFVFENRFHQWRLVMRRSETHVDAGEDPGLVCHLMALEGGEAHSVPYATLTSGIRYALVDEAATSTRWRVQTQRMRRFAKGA
ncbi:MAG: hypothetical protein ACRYGL_18180 [Janthinobacterium lividum]